MRLISLFSKVGLILMTSGLIFSSCTNDDDDTGFMAIPAAEQIEQYLTDNNITGELTTSSGLVYVIEEQGEAESPTLNDDITIHYEGYRINGDVFDQTTGSPRTFPLSRLILSWQEGIQLIGRGGKIKLISPPNLAYGNNPPAGSIIRAGDVLVFDIELVEFSN
jgi:FKBP-type peptidyl-prolyl cis-trans isomerase FkpA